LKVVKTKTSTSKTKTKTLGLKTKTKTLFFVLEAPRDQDFGLKDYITAYYLLYCNVTLSSSAVPFCMMLLALKSSAFYITMKTTRHHRRFIYHYDSRQNTEQERKSS